MNESVEGQSRWSSVDRWMAVALLVGGAAVGATYVRAFEASGQRTSSDFGQYDFAAAVALTCGRGFVDVGPGVSPALDDFLAVKVDRMSCAALPAALPPRPPDFTQRIYRYLMYCVALVWKARGVSWSALWPLFALFYGATVALAYGIFRLAVGRAGSAVAAVAVLGSALHLQHLPFLRDYTKATFILALLLLTAHAAKSAPRPNVMLSWSAAFGIVLGLGFGFRNDMLIMAPPFAAAVFLWTLPRDARAWGFRFACLAVAAVAFAVVAWPIVSGYRKGSNSGHVAVLGLMPSFEQPLGISPSVYEWGSLYLDRFVDATIASHAWRTGGRAVEYLSADYDREAFRYVLEVARHWPADILARAYASVLKIVDFPFTVGMYAGGTPVAFIGSPVAWFYERQHALLHLLQRTGIPLVAVSLAAVSARNVFRAVLLLVALIYFAGYPAIQFQLRHFFHLEFIAWWALVFVAERAIRAGIAAARARGGEMLSWQRVRPAAVRVFAFVAITIGLVFVPLTVARAYQQPHVRSLLRAYDAAAREPIAVEPKPRGDFTLLATPALWEGQEPGSRVRARYLVAEFSPACGALRIPVNFRYQPAAPELDFSYETVVDLGRGPATVFFPAYDTDQGSRFDGIEVPRTHESCLTRLTRVTDTRSFPLLLNLTLAGPWEEAPLYQTLTRWERQPIADAPEQRMVTLPRQLPVTRSVLDATLDSLPPVTVRARVVRDDGEARWIIHGTLNGAGSLLRLAPQHRTPADRFVVEGDVRGGGLTVGLLRGEAWANETNVTIATAGAFMVVLEPPGADDYGVLLAEPSDDLLGNAQTRLLPLAAWRALTDIRIRKAGWIKYTGSPR